MPYEEDFAPEASPQPAPEAPVAVVEMPVEAAPIEAAPEVVATEAAAPESSPEAAEAVPVEATEAVPAVDASAEAAPPVFVEKDWLKTALGDEAPETAAELKERLESYKSNQLTDEHKGKLAVLSDPAKLAEFAAIAGKDYDKPTAAEIMREKFAHDHPDMTPAQLDRRFSKAFAEKYPTLAAALENPDDYSADDPALVAEREDADYDAKADRAFFKSHQETTKNTFLAAAQAAAAPTAPQYTPEQVADAKDVLKWSDETFKDGYALPIDVGNGHKINMPIGDASAFKAAFANTDKLYLGLVNDEKGMINREMQAKIALFLSNPKGYDAYIANAVKSAAPPALPVAELANSSARQSKPAAAATAASTQPVYADEWHNSNA